MAFLLKISVLVIAITMAAATITLTITMNPIHEAGPQLKPNHHPDNTSAAPASVPPSKRVSRFLQAATTSHPSANPRAADHCKNDNDACSILGVGVGGTCCHNKCMDLLSDKNNCGACKNKCKFTHTCCNGRCVMTMFDKRHCGRCNNRCPEGQYCVYGMCNYG